MLYETIIRAWKDESFRNNLNEKERALLPENPAGLVELTDAHLEGAVGGMYLTTDQSTTARMYLTEVTCNIYQCL